MLPKLFSTYPFPDLMISSVPESAVHAGWWGPDLVALSDSEKY